MSEIIKSLMGDTKKLGRILALVIILGIAGGISLNITSSIASKEDVSICKAILDQWIDLAKIAIMFYFMKSMENKTT
jgi:hypothetical protein